MKVLLVNAYTQSGGAAVASRRLCGALNDSGVEARMLVQNREDTVSETVRQTRDRLAGYRPLLDAVPVLPYRNRRSPHWGNAWLANGATKRAIRAFSPDITHLHWVNHGMLSVRDIAQLKGPVVWTMHDSWAFTGGCHSPQECLRFREECGCCPELRSGRERDLSRWNWKRKQAAWQNADFTVVTPSRWLAQRAASSSLFAGKHIVTLANAIDPVVFQPVEPGLARDRFGLPADVPVFLFAAHGALDDWNKGGDLWRAALPAIAKTHPNAIAVIAGADAARIADVSFPLTVRALGQLSAPDLALAMNASDAVVVPSRMENLPNVIAESLSCGVPVAAFSTGGIPEMLRSGITGLLAPSYDAEALGYAVAALLGRRGTMRTQCLSDAAAYAPQTIAAGHLAIYQEALDRKRGEGKGSR